MNVPRNQRNSSGQLMSSPSPVVGALLVHGLNGCRRDMVEVEEMLRKHNIVTENILLPGHGSHVRDMVSLGWPEWEAAVRHELYLLKQRCAVVFLIGHSLGGALCLHTAAHEEVAGVVSMCAPLHLHPWLRPAVRMAKRITPLLPTLREDVRDPIARRAYTRDVYRWTPMAPVASMLKHLPQLRRELPQITVPVLVMAAVHDHVVPVRDGREIYRLLGSQEKHLVTLHHSYHVIMKDSDREEVFAKTLAFVQRHTTTSPLPQSLSERSGQDESKDQPA
jgi:carboxylesterase